MSDYLCTTWQGLLQMTVYLVGRGYYYHDVGTYPQKKRDKWLDTDRKMIAIYQCDKSKHQRVRMKKRGEARTMFLRWENVRVLLRTDGSLAPGVPCAHFPDIRDKYAKIPVSEGIVFFLYIDHKTGRATVRLTRESYLSIKVEIEETCRTEKAYKIINKVEHLNGLPRCHGVNEQKVNLAKLAVKWGKRARKRIKYSDIKIEMRKKTVNVFARI